MIKKFENFSVIQDVNDLRSYIEDEFPDLELSEVTDLRAEIPGGASGYNRVSNPISFKIKFDKNNSPLIYANKCETILKICDIIDFFGKTYDGLDFEFLLLWDLISYSGSRGEWFDIKSTARFRELIKSGEFTNPVEITLVFSGVETISESIDFGSLGDVFYPLEDDWNVDILMMDGLEIESELNDGLNIISLGNTFKNDPHHFYFYQEGGNDAGLFQTFTDGSGYDVMGIERKLIIMRPPNWVSGGEISFDYDLIEKVLSGGGDNFAIEGRNEYILIKIEVSAEEFFNNGDLIRHIQSKVKMTVNMYGLELFNTKDPYYRNGIFGAVMTDKKWEVNWLEDKLDSKKIWNELKDDLLMIRICFKK